MTKIGDYDITKHLKDVKKLSDEDSGYLHEFMQKHWKDGDFYDCLSIERGAITDARIRTMESKYQELGSEILQMSINYKGEISCKLPRFGVYSCEESSLFLISITHVEKNVLEIDIHNGHIFNGGNARKLEIPKKMLYDMHAAIASIFPAEYTSEEKMHAFSGGVDHLIKYSNKRESSKVLKGAFNERKWDFSSYMKTFLTDDIKKSVQESKKYLRYNELFFIVENDYEDFRGKAVFKDNVAIVGHVSGRTFLIDHLDREKTSRYKEIVYCK